MNFILQLIYPRIPFAFLNYNHTGLTMTRFSMPSSSNGSFFPGKSFSVGITNLCKQTRKEKKIFWWGNICLGALTRFHLRGSKGSTLQWAIINLPSTTGGDNGCILAGFLVARGYVRGNSCSEQALLRTWTLVSPQLKASGSCFSLHFL